MTTFFYRVSKVCRVMCTSSGWKEFVTSRWHMCCVLVKINREIAYERILAWKTEGAYEVFGNMYR